MRHREKKPVPPDAAFGRRVRLHRQKLGMTLEQVASKSGLARSFISEIERDLVSPSIASVLKLCRALELGFGDLFEDRSSTLIRAAERRRIDLGGHGFTDYALTPRNSRHILATWTELSPGASGGEDFYSLEADEELILVLDGALDVTFEGEETLIMRAGDALTLDPKRRRLIANHHHDRKTIVILVYTPPP